MNSPDGVVHIINNVPSTGKRKAPRRSRKQKTSSTPATALNFLNLCDDNDSDGDVKILKSSHSSRVAWSEDSNPTTDLTTSENNYPSSSHDHYYRDQPTRSSSVCIDLVDDEGDDTVQIIRQLEDEETMKTRERHRLEEESTLNFLRAEQEERQLSLMNKRYSCEICLQRDISLENMITLSCQPIGHRYCLECFNDYCVDKIQEAQVDHESLICPSIGCKTPITPHELKANVAPETYTRFEKFLLRKMAKENDWKCCPHCNNWFADISTEPEHVQVWQRVKCQNTECMKEFCARCGQEPHVKLKNGNIEMTCEEIAKLKADNLQDESLRELAKGTGWRQCPKCNAMSELIPGGCKFVYCTCKAKFCYLCGVQLTQEQHYTHFQGIVSHQGGKCTGPFGDKCKGPKDGLPSHNALSSSSGSRVPVPVPPPPVPAQNNNSILGHLRGVYGRYRRGRRRR